MYANILGAVLAQLAINVGAVATENIAIPPWKMVSANEQPFVLPAKSTKLGEGKYGEAHLLRGDGFRAGKVAKVLNSSRILLGLATEQECVESFHAEHEVNSKIFTILNDKDLDTSHFQKTELFHDDTGKPVLVSDHFEMSLKDFLNKKGNDGHSCKVVFDVGKQLLEALRILHQEVSYAHNDIHDGNICILDRDGTPHLKLIDFGKAERTTSSNCFREDLFNSAYVMYSMKGCWALTDSFKREIIPLLSSYGEEVLTAKRMLDIWEKYYNFFK